MKRKKCWLGAVIGAASGILGGIINSNKEKEQQRQQQILQNRNDTLKMANALSQGYGDQNYLNDFNNRVTFALGGKRCRRKFEDGGETKDDDAIYSNDNIIDSNAIDYNDIANGISKGINNIATPMFKKVNTINSVGNIVNATPKTKIINSSYYSPVLQNKMLRCGGRKRR